MRDWSFQLTIEQVPEGLMLLIGEMTAGPFTDASQLQRYRLQLFTRYRRRAVALGGFVWRRRADEWVATLPSHVPVLQGKPMNHDPCTIPLG